MRTLRLAIVAAVGVVTIGCASTSEPTVYEQLQYTANTLNASMPQMIDEETRLDSTYAEPTGFGYKYTMINYSAADLDLDKFTQVMVDQITPTVCTNPDMEYFREHNLLVTYNYVGKDNEFVSKIVVDTSKC